VARDPLAAFAACARLGVDRVLTSGAAASAPAGARVIAAMVAAATATAAAAHEHAGDAAAVAAEEVEGQPQRQRRQRPVVLAGGGVTAANVAALVAATGVTEVHGSARVAVPGGTRHRPARDEDIVYMGGERRNDPATEYSYKRATPASVAAVVDALLPLPLA
jgi:copper homeostasis protein